ncbi:hypothetical protein CD33_01440 [Ureibacillus sinduriensis BLB-1 = JCM 15800]|uniref:Uncharacterized protein n=1 Tax=Ureibacillus sinduriensis BLB-1 = JCM 15800 TaxID=1384057 RepID=A0A0A3I407_9BACL|nr:hypothetical protein CD33_01440 [Ureibacillus sinduriensis BLB-1 = JCM 15800]
MSTRTQQKSYPQAQSTMTTFFIFSTALSQEVELVHMKTSNFTLKYLKSYPQTKKHPLFNVKVNVFPCG